MSTSEGSFDWGDWLERSLWTGLQSALAVIVVTDISSLSAAATAFATRYTKMHFDELDKKQRLDP